LIEKIGEGAYAKVMKVNRFFEDELGNRDSQFLAMKVSFSLN